MTRSEPGSQRLRLDQNPPDKEVKPQPTTNAAARFVTNSNVTPQRTPHHDARCSPLRDSGAPTAGRRFHSHVLARARLPTFSPPPPPGEPRAFQGSRASGPALGHYLRARWMSVPIGH